MDLRLPTLTITLPDTTVELIAAPRSKIRELRSDFVKLQSYWLENVFSTGETIADPQCWELMKGVIATLPRRDNPAVCGVDLEAIANDYPQLERLFFADTKAIAIEDLHGWSLINFDMARFVGCQILALHLINPKRLIQDAEELRAGRAAAVEPALSEKKVKRSPMPPEPEHSAPSPLQPS